MWGLKLKSKYNTLIFRFYPISLRSSVRFSFTMQTKTQSKQKERFIIKVDSKSVGRQKKVNNPKHRKSRKKLTRNGNTARLTQGVCEKQQLIWQREMGLHREGWPDGYRWCMNGLWQLQVGSKTQSKTTNYQSKIGNNPKDN